MKNQPEQITHIIRADFANGAAYYLACTPSLWCRSPFAAAYIDSRDEADAVAVYVQNAVTAGVVHELLPSEGVFPSGPFVVSVSELLLGGDW